MSRDSSQPCMNPAAAASSSRREVSYEISRSASTLSSVMSRPIIEVSAARGGDFEESLQAPARAPGHPALLAALLGLLVLALSHREPLAQLGGIERGRLIRLLDKDEDMVVG